MYVQFLGFKAPIVYRIADLMLQEYDKDQAGKRQGLDDDDDDDDDEQGGGTGWQSVEIDSRPVDLASVPETCVLDEEPVVKHGLAAALLLARKKGLQS
jgi:hypothetical protein